ncbi:MAG: potassium channel family protein [Bacteroidota bacterium]
MACIYTSKSYQDLVILGLLGITNYVLFLLYSRSEVASVINPIITLTFFGFVFTRLMEYVFSPKSVTINDVYALSAGYIILGVIAAPFFFLVNMQLENALSISQDASFSDLLYFSYITLTGVGYGDITPVHPIAKSLSLLLGIIGQLYLAVLVGIIIGKYISNGERL